jgi:hypothetical protein
MLREDSRLSQGQVSFAEREGVSYNETNETQPRTDSGLSLRVVESLPLSLRTGGGACSTWAAVGPEWPLESEPFSPGLRDGGVVDPVNTGNSSALGTRCFVVVGLLSTLTPLTTPLAL